MVQFTLGIRELVIIFKEYRYLTYLLRDSCYLYFVFIILVVIYVKKTNLL